MPQVFIALAATLLILWVLWPRFVVWAIGRKQTGGLGEKIHDNIGAVVIVLAGVLAVALAAIFVLLDDDRSWLDPEPSVTAIGVVVGVVFVYSRLFPPAFWPSFYQVVNFSTGDWERTYLTELDIGLDRPWAIFVEVHNTGVTPWNNYRVTVEFQGGFQLLPKIGSVPASDSWVWPTQFRPRGIRQDFLQVQAGNTLAVAEAQTLRFVASSPRASGRYKVVVKVVADGRLSESRRELWVNVIDGLEPPSS